ncbi:vacuolar import and degradation protein-domain-containing protein [Corynascus novoguineensis]|uniref:Vacuolar import and degradation protein-domain-containing protein n=1 Tax=Corynascus novoguineensis TaxID=1126955 RepID=A0AAN7HNH6_9PEZI|nr:vacuolar import and degradation protein-domain-containing protein [Corynascus novoguineensis]
MPTPSSNRPDPPSPRFYPFSTCPDPDEQQPTTLQPISGSDPVSFGHQSPSSWRPLSPPAYPDDRGSSTRPETAVSGESHSDTMSPGPQTEGDSTGDVQMGHGSEGLAPARDDSGERHKPADVDESMRPAGVEPSRRDAHSQMASGSRGGTASGATSAVAAVGGDLSRRRRSGAERVPPSVDELIHEVDVWGPVGKGPRWAEDSGLMGLGLEYSHMRVMTPAPSLYLQPGSRFVGTQQSERQRYDVEVEIKHVDMRESFLCGYLKIQGLTDDHPTLTTYFEGEIIGTKYGFVTQHQGWGASEKIDLSHWSKFTAFQPYLKRVRKGGNTVINDVDQRENIFMRWKEHFLVPDHRVRTINGASFEGFYYICFNQAKGEVSGIYFHSKSEKFQQLELRFVENRGCFGAVEYR